MFASPNTRRKREIPEGTWGKRMNRRESKYLWVMSVSEVCNQSSRFGSDVSISEAVERKVVWRPGVSTTEWRKELRGDRDYVGKILGKIRERGRPGNLRLLNYREIIKSISLFTTPYCRPTTTFRYYSEMEDSLRLSHNLLSDFYDFSNPSCTSII